MTLRDFIQESLLLDRDINDGKSILDSEVIVNLKTEKGIIYNAIKNLSCKNNLVLINLEE